MVKDEIKTNPQEESHSMKIGNITVNVKSCFYPEKNLYEIMYAIASTRLKEKSA